MSVKIFKVVKMILNSKNFKKELMCVPVELIS